MDPAQAEMRARREEAVRDRYLEAARDSNPGWDIEPVFGGFQAVPAGTPVVRALTLDALIAKLREREEPCGS